MTSNQPLSQQFYEAAQQWCDLECAASILEESKSAFLSQSMLKCGDIAVSKAELQTKGSEIWAEYITKMVKARTLANKARIYMEFLKMRAFEEQSRQATERTQARL